MAMRVAYQSHSVVRTDDMSPAATPRMVQTIESLTQAKPAIIGSVARVYLETSFFSACVSQRRDALSVARRDQSRRWWIQQRAKHSLFMSSEVVRELSAPTYLHRDEALALTVDAVTLPLNEEIRGLARIFVREKAMPGPEGSGDAIHMAATTAHQMDAVLSWNVKHLANRNKVVHLREVCRRVGFVAPEIITPDAFWTIEEE